MLLSSMTASKASPSSPRSAKPGRLAAGVGQRGVAEAALAALGEHHAGAGADEVGDDPAVGVLTTVPAGTRRTFSSPRAPCRLLPSPGLAVAGLLVRAVVEVQQRVHAGSTSRTMSPPSPPLPPSGPPSGLYFSRWTEDTPCPPLPAATCTVTRSTKAAISAASYLLSAASARAPGPCARRRNVVCVLRPRRP
jgi:hypothetical protein